MADLDRRPLLGQVAVAPLAQRHQDGIEVEAHLGEPVTVPGADVVLVGLAAKDARLDQTAEPLREEEREIPSVCWKSSKRLIPLKAWRRITSVHRSPSKAAGLAIEHLCSASSEALIGPRIPGLRSEAEPYMLRSLFEPKGAARRPTEEDPCRGLT